MVTWNELVSQLTNHIQSIENKGKIELEIAGLTKTFIEFVKEHYENIEKISASLNKLNDKKLGLGMVLSKLNNSSVEEKKYIGTLVNDIKTQAKEIIEAIKKDKEKIKNNLVDEVNITLDGLGNRLGSINPLTYTIFEIKSVMEKLGFVLQEGAIIETQEYNFDLLNIVETHPARTDHDTFYVKKNSDKQKDLILRTQTSNCQVYALKEKKLPIKIYSIGKVFRCDSDSTHLPTFHQVEMLYINDDANITSLKYVISKVLELFFGKKIEYRLRPSFFPFTEPSYELDMMFNGRFLEVGGCGMTHPKVLSISPYYQKDITKGFAFGFGIERLCMLKYNIKDIRNLVNYSYGSTESFRYVHCS